MGYKDPDKQREYQRKWMANKLNKMRKLKNETEEFDNHLKRRRYSNKKHREKATIEINKQLQELLKGEQNGNQVNTNSKESEFKQKTVYKDQRTDGLNQIKRPVAGDSSRKDGEEI